MNVLIIADSYPTPDRNSADFRFLELLGMVVGKHEVFYCAIDEKRQIDALGNVDVMRYRSALQTRGVRIAEGGVRKALRARSYAAVVFEWFFTAREFIDEVRTSQPAARVVVDSVDVVFNRLAAKARVTQRSDDATKAAATKSAELAAYEKADVVITVTDADAAILHRENPRIATFTIPNIHPQECPVPIPEAHDKRLVFIGSFIRPGGETNVDAMVYFCREILPLIVEAEPGVRLRIIGSSPPAEIVALASDHVEVLGFVPDVKPFLEDSVISIAPLRFGGGMKGKIGEAMSLGLPVVTTSTGIEGFGLQPGADALVADNPGDFADAVIRLLRDREYLERVRMAGYRFIVDHYSDRAAKRRVDALFGHLEGYPVKRMALVLRWWLRAKERWERHVGWRLK